MINRYMYFSTAKEMEKLDELAVQSGLEIRQMMELAGWHMFGVFNDLSIFNDKSVSVVCGRGNKGGDGLSAARHLFNYGYNVSVILLSKDLKEDPKHHLELLEKMDVDIIYYKTDKDQAQNLISLSDVVIDSLLGYHLDGNPRGNYAEIIKFINNTKVKVISYDIPSGIDASTGECLVPCIKADVTMTLALPKKVFKSSLGLKQSGQVYLADIGISSFLYDQIAENSRPDFGEKGFMKL